MKNIENGNLVISLDFEKMWGIHDGNNWDNSINYIENVNIIVPKILSLFKKYNISATWATVGILFLSNKDELINITKNVEKPTYENQSFSAYTHFCCIKNDDKVSFAPELIKNIMQTPNQEIASHTFSHYYCKEAGQTIDQFNDDLKLSIKVSKQNNVNVKTLVFPKNQYDNKCLEIAKNNGIKAFRGLEENWINKIKNKKIRRFMLFVSTYLPIVRGECYNVNKIKKEELYNIKSSFFFRAATKNKLLELLKLKRVKKLMKRAAKKRLVCHIWFHPHNLSKNIELGLRQLENILKYYTKLSIKYNFKSININNLVEEIEK